MDLVCDSSLPLPDLVNHLDVGSPGGPAETAVEPLQAWNTAEGEPSQEVCLSSHGGQEGARAWVCRVGWGDGGDWVCGLHVPLSLMGLQCFLGTGHACVPLTC